MANKKELVISPFAKKIAENELSEMPPNSFAFEPIDSKKKSLEFEIQKELNNSFLKIKDGLEIMKQIAAELGPLNNQMEQDYKTIAQKIDYFEENVEEFIETFNQDKSLMELLQLDKETINNFYKAAKYLYEQNDYKNAANAFQLLVLLQSGESIFWLGLGNSEFFCQNYNAANQAYETLFSFDPSDPLSRVYSARCLLELQDFDAAESYCSQALEIMANNPKYTEMIEEVQDLNLQILNKKQHGS